MKITPKQIAALEAAAQKGGLFQTTLTPGVRHSPALLSALVKAGLLRVAPIGCIWALTEKGQAVLAEHQAASKGAKS